MADGLTGIWGVPPGADFPRAVAETLIRQYDGAPPEALARVRIYVNAPRMRRRLTEAFAASGVRLTPRIGLVTDPGSDPLLTDLPLPAPPLRRTLDLARLVRALIRRDPDLAPEAAVYDLAESLGGLIDEMDGEGVPVEALDNLDTGEMSAHWDRSLTFLRIAADYARTADAPGKEARSRAAVAALAEDWRRSPPEHPVIVAGSTGSRGTTADLMAAVAALPRGALILPGFDFDVPPDVWGDLSDALTTEDHPQFRYAALLARLGRAPSDVALWPGAAAPDRARNRLISLALRPAPVTDRWAREGPALGDLGPATARLTLLEAPNERVEAEAIALRLRRAVEDGTRAALVTPDRTLARRVTAALDRWGLEPDDSAGRPLGLSPPGRLLRLVAGTLAEPLTPVRLIALLRHPLTAEGGRRDHVRLTDDLDRRLRRHPVAMVGADALSDWVGKSPVLDEDARRAWAGWIAATLPPRPAGPHPLALWTDWTVTAAARLCAGPDGAEGGTGGLWDREAGEKAKAAIETLAAEAPRGEDVDARDFRRILDHALQGEVRETETPHPDLMIRGTLEARTGGADLVILGGLNDGTWPAQPAPDPWLNRPLRAAAGLLLPDRQIGLSAHDFQQAAGGAEVWLTRAVRGAEAETVASRWLLRLTNLLSGLPATGGDTALKAMRARGADWIRLAEGLDRRLPKTRPEPRPAPVPPATAKPRELSVTRIQTLIRDPYAIYARQILNLRPLDPLTARPDARLRGNLLHDVLHAHVEGGVPDDPKAAARAMIALAEATFASLPWPAVARLWSARFAGAAPAIALAEAARQADGTPIAHERKGSIEAPAGFTLIARADRIDRRADGTLAIWDYKSSAPSEKQVIRFDRQLPLEAVIAEAGGFADVPAAPVAHVGHIPLSEKRAPGPHAMDETADRDFRVATVRTEFEALIAAMLADGFGFASRRMQEKVAYEGDYDHLARFGEWQDSDPVTKVPL